MGPGETTEHLGNGEGAAQKIETHPTITLASNDESAMNIPRIRKTIKMSKKEAYDLKNCCEFIAYR